MLIGQDELEHDTLHMWPSREYLETLVQYLQSFHERTQPLQSISKQLSKLEADFAEEWKAGTVPGWTEAEEGASAGDGTQAAGAIDVEAFDSVEELEQLGEP